MSLRINDFKKYDGVAYQENQGDYELLVYLDNSCNVDVAIVCKEKDRYSLYNFIVDKDHMKNMKEINWFNDIKKIQLFKKNIKQKYIGFINYALKYGVEIELLNPPF